MGLQKQEPRALKSGELAPLEKALRSVLIAESGLKEISQVLRLVMMKIGIREANLPSKEETAVLFDHIIENFGGHRIEEIKLAFEMAIAGKLEIEPKDVKCYENFSCAYFSSIMNAYRLWSVEAARQLVIDMPPSQTLYTDAQLDDQQREDIEHFYQRLRKGQVPYAIPHYFKAMLVKDKIMKEEDNIAAFFTTKLGNAIENIYKKAE